MLLIQDFARCFIEAVRIDVVELVVEFFLVYNLPVVVRIEGINLVLQLLKRADSVLVNPEQLLLENAKTVLPEHESWEGV